MRTTSHDSPTTLHSSVQLNLELTAPLAISSYGIEENFDPAFSAKLALKEKQIQQTYRPIIGIHKWFARRPGTLFRSLLLAEFVERESLEKAYWHSHALQGTIADPFMGGGTPIFEANRLGFQILGCDINPMAHWVVRQSLSPLDLAEFRSEAERVVSDVERRIGDLYKTKCAQCGKAADVKYFLWVKTSKCPSCKEVIDLFPGYRLAEDVRHPKHVLACASCGSLNEYEEPPTMQKPKPCLSCGEDVTIEGNVQRQKATCPKCKNTFPYTKHCSHPPEHRLWAIEYHCVGCYQSFEGRQFKSPDFTDKANLRKATQAFIKLEPSLDIPQDEIPNGDESDRLHRWGYRKYREMFNERQLLGLGLLRARILKVKASEVRRALLTVFSDFLRYQNMLCRYDTYALKCQDIFSVHGFPVGLIQCENSILGIPKIGSGAFRHFVEKYNRAKHYCVAPTEVRHSGKKKEIVPIFGETIQAQIVKRFQKDFGASKQALLYNQPSQCVPLKANSLDGVFTDPPYFDNVQYAELMDFCYVWLRQALASERGVFGFTSASTRSQHELTGNATLGRGIEHFSEGISKVFCNFAQGLKPRAPFVFTYHHNDPYAYLPLIVGILDADLVCTATLPAVGEMAASLHIAGTGSSVLDSVFVCRRTSTRRFSQGSNCGTAREECTGALVRDVAAMQEAGVMVKEGDVRCLLAGHLARLTIRSLRSTWVSDASIRKRLERARLRMQNITDSVNSSSMLEDIISQIGKTRISL